MKPSVVADPAQLARRGGAHALAALLRAQREQLLAAHARLPDRLPEQPGWNLPIWERGHVAWFAERWTLRQPEPWHGAGCDASLPLPPGRCADAYYDSSAVPHARRWLLPLPDAAATRALLDAQLDATLQRLALLDREDDATLYLYRLVLLHEAMHEEAAWLMARQLGLPTPAAAVPPPGAELSVPAQRLTLGHEGPGFAFDNELAAQPVEVAAFRIDARARRWADVLPWARGAAYRDDRLWSPAGLAWRGARWLPDALRLLPEPDPGSAAEGLSAHEAEAWCRWAGRRLPSEAEWQAASRLPGFAWGEVWEWCAAPFAPFVGFAPHPYRDYSQPWFDGHHRLLKGASRCTPAVLRDLAVPEFLPAGADGSGCGWLSVAGGPLTEVASRWMDYLKAVSGQVGYKPSSLCLTFRSRPVMSGGHMEYRHYSIRKFLDSVVTVEKFAFQHCSWASYGRWTACRICWTASRRAIHSAHSCSGERNTP